MFVHMVSAWATEDRVVLGQVKTEEKSNEITAIARLLELLRIKGATVTIWTSTPLDELSQRKQWSNLACVVLVEVDRTVDGKTSTEQRYYISSKKRLRAKAALSIVQRHWGIENERRWVLDVAFREDDCRVRAGYAAENFAVMRHITLNLLKKAA